MEWLIIMSTSFFLVGCVGNKTQIPEHIDVNVPNTTQTVNVIHTIELSANLENIFRTSCENEFKSLNLPTELKTEWVNQCVATKSNQFIADFMQVINQGMAQSQAQQPK